MSRNGQSWCSGFKEIRQYSARNERGLAGHASTGEAPDAKTISGSLFDHAHPAAPDATMQRSTSTQSVRENHTRGNEFEDSTRRGKITTKTVLQGGDRERDDLGKLTEAVKFDVGRKVQTLPTKRQEAADTRPTMGEVSAAHSGKSTEEQLELVSGLKRRLCTNCGIRERYNETATMDWCETCIWEYVNDSQD